MQRRAFFITGNSRNEATLVAAVEEEFNKVSSRGTKLKMYFPNMKQVIKRINLNHSQH